MRLVRRFLARFGANTAAALLVSGLNATSKALGLARELFMAWAFGTSAVVDAYRIGLTVSTYLSHLFFGEAMTGAVVPVLARARASDGETSDGPALKAGLTLAGLAITIPAGLLLLGFPELVVDLLTPDLSPDQRHWTVLFMRIFGLSVPLYSLTAIVVMVRRAKSDFRPLGWRPVGQNLFLIAGIVLAYATDTPLLIPVSFLVYYAVLLAGLDRGAALASLSFGLRRAAAGLRPVAARWLPLAIGLMLLRSNTLVERYFGSRLPAGSIAALDYARTLTDVPMLLLAVPAGAVLLTAVSRSQRRRLTLGQKRKLSVLVALSFLASAALVVAAEPLTRLLFQRGAFAGESVRATAAALRGLGAGAWAMVLGHIATQYIMATRSPWTLALPAGVSVTANILLSVRLVPLLGLLGLALASSAAAVTFVALCAAALWRQPPRRTGTDAGTG